MENTLYLFVPVRHVDLLKLNRKNNQFTIREDGDENSYYLDSILEMYESPDYDGDAEIILSQDEATICKKNTEKGFCFSADCGSDQYSTQCDACKNSSLNMKNKFKNRSIDLEFKIYELIQKHLRPHSEGNLGGVPKFMNQLMKIIYMNKELHFHCHKEVKRCLNQCNICAEHSYSDITYP